MIGDHVGSRPKELTATTKGSNAASCACEGKIALRFQVRYLGHIGNLQVV